MIFSTHRKIARVVLILVLFSSVLSLTPVFVVAQGNDDTSTSGEEVKKTGFAYDCANERGDKDYGECTFNDLLLATDRVVTFGRNLALSFSVIVIAYAGYKYMVSGDKASEREDANKMFVKVGKGILLILGAWLIVHLITTSLLKPEFLDVVPLAN